MNFRTSEDEENLPSIESSLIPEAVGLRSCHNFVIQRGFARRAIQDMEISVVLATYNRAASLGVTLASFSKLIYPAATAWELIIVDNNSTDATPEVIREFSRAVNFPVHYVFEKRQGRSAALNTGIAEAQGNIIAFTDDDVLLHPNWIVNLRQAFDRFDCAAVAGRVLPQWNYAKPDWLEMDGQFAVVNFDLGDETKEIQVPPLGANCAFRKDIFTKYGLFRLDLGVSGSTHTVTCDDTEFGERVIRGREKIVYCPTALIYHPVEPVRTTKQYFISWYYYNGVSLRRTAGLPTEGIFTAGVPRWMCRELITNCVRWIFTPQPKLRFQRKLKTYRTAGDIVECYRLSHLKKPGDAAPELQKP